MLQQEQWYADNPESENIGLSLASDTQAFAGHLGKARRTYPKICRSPMRADSKENGAIWWENAALREAAFGNFREARQAATTGLKLTAPAKELQSRLRWLMP